MAIALLSFMFSCSDDADPVKPDPEVKAIIELVSIEGTDINKSLSDLPDGETEMLISFHTTITNNGTTELKLIARMEIMALADGQSSYFCWGDIDKNEGTCYPPMTADYTSDRTMTVKAGETTPPGNFLQYLNNANVEGGEAKIRYIVYEDGKEDNRDTIIYNINVTK